MPYGGKRAKARDVPAINRKCGKIEVFRAIEPARKCMRRIFLTATTIFPQTWRRLAMSYNCHNAMLVGASARSRRTAYVDRVIAHAHAQARVREYVSSIHIRRRRGRKIILAKRCIKCSPSNAITHSRCIRVATMGRRVAALYWCIRFDFEAPEFVSYLILIQEIQLIVLCPEHGVLYIFI